MQIKSISSTDDLKRNTLDIKIPKLVTFKKAGNGKINVNIYLVLFLKYPKQGRLRHRRETYYVDIIFRPLAAAANLNCNYYIESGQLIGVPSVTTCSSTSIHSSCCHSNLVGSQQLQLVLYLYAVICSL